jgi:hypothetical protein
MWPFRGNLPDLFAASRREFHTMEILHGNTEPLSWNTPLRSAFFENLDKSFLQQLSAGMAVGVRHSLHAEPMVAQAIKEVDETRDRGSLAGRCLKEAVQCALVR